MMKKQKAWNLLLLAAAVTMLLPALIWAAYPAEVPWTGQTTSYATGDDGDLLPGIPWPDPRFSYHGDNQVHDSLTGLVWEIEANRLGNFDNTTDHDCLPDSNPPAGCHYIKADNTTVSGDGMVFWWTAFDYVDSLNTRHYGGRSDWRLPNINELESLVNYQNGNSNLALPNGNPFLGFQPGNYWSSTTYANDPHYAWHVDFSTGYTDYYVKGNVHNYVIAVAGDCSGGSAICLPKTGQTISYYPGDDGDIQAGVASPVPRFIDNGNTTTDNLTGLVWAKNANLLGSLDADNDTDGIFSDGMVTWQHALDYIKKLNREKYLGYSDWRLPSSRELHSFADYADTLVLPFTNLKSGDIDYYWSSTTDANNTASQWLVTSSGGYVKPYYGGFNYVHPVRGGLHLLFGDLFIFKSGTGTGTVTRDLAGIDCGVNCYEYKDVDVKLTAVADSDSVFVAWSGDCSGIEPCTVTMDSSKSVTAIFQKRKFNLTVTVTGTGSGTVTSDPAAINCVSTCTATFIINQAVTLTAVPDAGSVFTNWSGGCSGSGACTVTMNSAKSVTAVFTSTGGGSTTTSSSSTTTTTTGGGSTTTSSSSTTTTTTGGGSTTTSSSSSSSSSSSTTTTTSGGGGGGTTTTPGGGGTTTIPITTSTRTTILSFPGSYGGCPIGIILGNDNPDLENLRAFRDSTLAQSAVGRRIIQIYYNNAESVNAALERSPALRAVARSFFEAAAWVVGGKE